MVSETTATISTWTLSCLFNHIFINGNDYIFKIFFNILNLSKCTTMSIQFIVIFCYDNTSIIFPSCSRRQSYSSPALPTYGSQSSSSPALPTYGSQSSVPRAPASSPAIPAYGAQQQQQGNCQIERSSTNSGGQVVCVQPWVRI